MLTWIEPHEPLPPPERARVDPNGLLAAGRDLSAGRLLEAYGQGIFPWYSQGQPVLWWSPDPRMVVFVDEFEPSRSLRKTLRRVDLTGSWKVTLDQAFVQVMQACAAPRPGQDGTWITRDIIKAYHALASGRPCPLGRDLVGGSLDRWSLRCLDRSHVLRRIDVRQGQ